MRTHRGFMYVTGCLALFGSTAAVRAQSTPAPAPAVGNVTLRAPAVLTSAEAREYDQLRAKAQLTQDEKRRLEFLSARSAAVAASAKEGISLLKELPLIGGVFTLPPNGVLPGWAGTSSDLTALLSFTAPVESVITPNMREKRIDVEVERASLQDTIKGILERGQSSYQKDGRAVPVEAELEDAAASAPRLTLRLKNVTVATALDVATQSSAVRWHLERRNGKVVVVVGPNVGPESPLTDTYGRWTGQTPLPVVTFLNSLNGRHLNEQRLTFTCPHCKGKSTMIRENQQPKCPKCARLFEKEWKFCPVDGTKRPSSPGQWRYCPSCGREVDPEREPAGGKDSSGGELQGR